MDRRQHVGQRVGRVGIVDDGRVAVGRLHRLQSATHAVEGRERHEDVLGSLAQHACGAIDRQQVAHIELTDKLHTHLMAVYVEVHASEVHLDDACAEVGHLSDGVGLHRGLGVLHHHHAVFVVGVGNGEGRLGQAVEERLLGVAVVLERLVVVEMVACEVGEDAAGKLQSADALLCDGVA